MRNIDPISKIMSTNIIALNREDDLEMAERLFKRHKIRHIPVVREGVVVGMLSYTDLLRISFADAVEDTDTDVDSLVYNMFTIDQVMIKNVVTVTSDASIKDVAKLLASKEFHAVPVVDNGLLVGIVTTTDLINYLLEQL
ncbi:MULTISPECIES: CBS domain-containing protein [Winogradskyella]|uniref:CBS domain-containing protein n=1 Tax=Winogradskyella TaxID=286104 RepID=UPI0015CD9417|nr:MULTISPECIES: CBS domain-containing protein [Winogradskyella]QXP80008.1 CBS domain-containing protein [Winogradskyella sp. HaHa_3_26]